MSSIKDLKGRIALITGASRGIGRAAALALAQAGAHVVIAARTQGALEELDDEIVAAGGSATILQLDLRKGDRVDQLGPTLLQRWERLDILVANAGVLGPLSPLGHVTVDGWDMVQETNLDANWRLIRTLDPLLKRSNAGRVVFVTSGAAAGTHAYWGPYAVSKAGLEALARTYAAECENTNVRVALLDAGAVRTHLRAKAFPGEDPTTLPGPSEIAPLFVELASPQSTSNGHLVSATDWLARKRNASPSDQALKR